VERTAEPTEIPIGQRMAPPQKLKDGLARFLGALLVIGLVAFKDFNKGLQGRGIIAGS
jgi:hypothetical protein